MKIKCQSLRYNVASPYNSNKYPNLWLSQIEDFSCLLICSIRNENTDVTEFI